MTELIGVDDEVRTGLEEFVRRTISGDVQEFETKTGTVFLARILAARDQQR